DDPAFMHPENMRQAITDYCRKIGGKAPQTRGEFTRCVLESLAERYKRGIDELQQFLEEPITGLHIIGGGSQNKMLNQLTA
ncbi:FGGY-family carbohydrate kinase, partial [Streptococcus pyogenes]